METITLQNISDFKGDGQLYTADNRYNPCVQLAADTSLTLDRANLNPDSPPSKSTFSLWLKREAGAILKIGTADGYLQIAEDGKLSLTNGSSVNGSPVGSVSLPFRLSVANSDFVTVDTNGNAIATADEWHHLAWIKKDDQHMLYFNGIACQAQALPAAYNPATINTITAEEAAVYVVHFHGYDRALEATEVVADKMSQHNATKSFTDQYPLNFTLKDRLIEGAPEMSDDKLIIEDITGKERTYQRLVITNVSGEALRFVEGTGEVSNTNHHLEVRFRNGTFVSPSEYPKFDGFDAGNLSVGDPPEIPADWQATPPLQHPQDGSWSVYLLRTAALEVAFNDTLEFPFEYTTADGSLGGRSTRVALSYQQMEYADDAQTVAGIREKQIDIINNSSNNAHVSALNKKVTEADAKVDQLEEDARKEIDHLATLLNSHASGSKDRLSNPSIPSSINVWQETNSYSEDDYVTKDGKLYKATSDIASDTPWNVANWEDRGTPSKEVLKSIIGVLGTLADNIKAVDDEVDKRAVAQDAINDMLEKSFPLVASVSAPEGVVCGDSGTSLQFTLTNNDTAPITFTENVEFRFKFPLGEGIEALAVNAAATGSNPSSTSSGTFKEENSSPTTQIYTWKPSSGETFEAGEIKTFTISGITPNATPGFVTIFIEYQGIVGYPSGKLSVAVSKVSRDIAQLVGGDKVGIGTNDPQVKLHISSGTSGDAILLLEADTDNNNECDNPMIQLRQDNGTVGVNIGFDEANFGGNKFGIGSRYDNDYYDTFIIDTASGNVGIGTTTINSDIKLQVAGNVNTTGKLKEDGHDLIPEGTIVMWNGVTAPDGWALCDGQNGTPDLSGRFIMGKGGSYSVGQKGGAETVRLVTSEMPAHTHGPGDYHTSTDGSHSHKYEDRYIKTYNKGGKQLQIESNEKDGYYGELNRTTSSDGNHSHDINGKSSSTGQGSFHENRPPYYVLAYIIRVH